MIQGKNIRNSEWTESIAVGSKGFIETIIKKFGALATGRKMIGENDGFQLREPSETYNAVFDTKNEDIGAENSYFWNKNLW